MNVTTRLARGLLLGGLWIGLLVSAPARAAEEARTYDYRQRVLDNGLRVITLEDFSCPIVAVQIWYHVGSKDEHPERQGFAHMFEHMMFRGTDRLGPTDHFDLIRQTGGTTNGYTSFDRTVYLQTLPANQLELALWLEAERMALLRIDQESFDTERKVVEEERRMGLNRPYGTLSEKLLAELFRVHPYRWSPIGNIPHLRAATVEELRSFWETYYVPNNATLLIVGAVAHDEAQRLAERYFGWIPRAADPPRVTVREPEPAERRSVEIREQNAPAPLVLVAYPTVAMAHDDAAALEVLSQIVGSGPSSRLYRKLVAESQLAVQVIMLDYTLEQAGFLGVGAVMPPIGSKPDEVLAIVEAEIERVGSEPVTERELTKARNRLIRDQVVDNLTIDSKARTLGTAAVEQADVERANRRLDEIRRVSADDVRRVARTYLKPERSLVARVPRNLLGSMLSNAPAEDASEPAASKKAESAPEPGLTRPDDFPAEPPLAGVLDEIAPVERSETTLSNGLKVVVVPNHEVPFISIRLGLLAGSWTEATPGAASMAMQMLTRGSAGHTEAELAEELGTYAISLSGASDMDTAGVFASCLTEHVDRAMDLLAEVVRTPTFPDDEFAKLRKQIRTGLEVASAEASYVADRQMRRELFGDHPYSRTATGEIDDVDRLAIGDLKRWHGKFVRPDMAVLIFAGDVDAPRAVELAERGLGDWAAVGPRPRLELPAPPTPQPTRVILVDRPGSLQSEIRLGQLGFGRHDPGYYTSRLVSDYFGGAFDSWLNEAVRVKKGLTYGARGGFRHQRFGGSFQAATFTKNESTAEAVETVVDQIERLTAEAPSADDLKKRQTYYVGSFARDRETPQQVAGDLWTIESNDLPDDFFETMVASIGRTTPEQCLTLAQQKLDPSRLAIIVVGDAGKIEADLKKIAPLSTLNPEVAP